MAEVTQSPRTVHKSAISHPASERSKKTRHRVKGTPKPRAQPRQDVAAASGPDLGKLEHAQVTRAAFEQDQVGVAITGVDGRIRRANRALASLLQYSPKELAGKTMKSLVRKAVHPDEPPAGTLSMARQSRGSAALNYLSRKSGDTVACLVDSKAIHDEQGKVTHFLVFVTNASSPGATEERNRVEDEAYRAQALQTLGMLAAGVAHDFNNVLEVILGFASLARVRLTPTDPLHEPLKIIEESAKGAAELARQLLDVSKDSADSNEPVDTRELLSSALSIVSHTFDRKIRIEHRVSSHLPLVKGSRSRLEQAILNLCINARDAMEQGGTLTLEASVQNIKPGDVRRPDSNEPGTYVRISIRDTGEGMPAEVQEKIFVPLFTTKAKGRGFGLGLATVDRIVKEAGGFISVASKPGRGSEFSLYLPAVFSGQPRRTSHTTGEVISGSCSVLVVDDEPRVLEFLLKGLAQLGYKVLTARSGSEACRIYSSKRHEIDCVLLDLIMPGMSGLETYARLKDINPGVRVILSSGYSSGRIRREVLESGSLKFLEKPYSLQELSEAMRKVQQN